MWNPAAVWGSRLAEGGKVRRFCTGRRSGPVGRRQLQQIYPKLATIGPKPVVILGAVLHRH